MSPLPYDRLPQLEIVPTEPTPTKRDKEEAFWEKNAHVPVEEILKKGSKLPRKRPLN